MENTNLYPPIIDTYMPAFIRSQNCKVYFSLSSYNNLSDIKYAQISIQYQNTNNSAFNLSTYPTEIKLTKVLEDTSRVDKDKFYVEIGPKDIQGGIFNINTYYKVQIRFCDTNTPDSGVAPSAVWLTDNRQHFSEWSTVTLVRGIDTPIILLNNWNDTNVSVSSTALTVVGTLTFNNTLEKESLKSYKLFLYDDSNDSLCEEAEDIYLSDFSFNEINYSFKFALNRGKTYRLKIEYITENLYEGSATYYLTVATVSAITAPTSLSINAELNQEIGGIHIMLNFKNSAALTGKVIIKRTSAYSNFQRWETLHIVADGQYSTTYDWYDLTIESGVFYKYGFVYETADGVSDIVEIKNSPTWMLILEDIYLMADGLQLAIKFNPQVSSIKYVLNESITNTLGSQYPYIRRNGNTKYLQFSFSGLISSEADEHQIFTNKYLEYGDLIDDYEKYNQNNKINHHNDIIYEQKFREKVMDFLYNNSIKLYRSATEGNVLVKLMDITFTPIATLGRRIYSFSATAYQVDDFNIENLENYNILIKTKNINYSETNEIALQYLRWDSNDSLVISESSIDNNTLIQDSYYSVSE